MSGRVLRFEGSAHREAERLLPWLVNGTLQEDERALVQQHLGECPACQRELAWLQALQAACVEETLSPPMDTTRSLRRLRRQLAPAQVGRHVWGQRRRPWSHWLIAAQAVLVLALGASLLRISHPPVVSYHTLGAAETAQDRLVVVFDPHLGEAQMRRLLRASDARIVDGPTDAGAYVLSVPAVRAATVREALRAAPGVILVESLDSRGGH